MNDISISIIIPVYNGEKFLEKCIDKLGKDMRGTHCELIIIDDGSTDRTRDLLQQYTNVARIISKSNGGVSSARNLGIEVAHGKYITFIDIDDEIPENILKDYECIISEYENVECVQGCFEKVNEESRCYYIDAPNIQKLCLAYPGMISKVNSELSLNASRGVHGCYGKLFNKTILNKYKIRFPEDLGLGEDLWFYYQYLSHIDKVLIFEKQTYIIIDNQESATRSCNARMPEYAVLFSTKLLAIIGKSSPNYYEACYQVSMHYALAINSYYFHIQHKKQLNNKELKTFISQPCFHEAFCELFKRENKMRRKLRYFLISRKLSRTYLIMHKITKKY